MNIVNSELQLYEKPDFTPNLSGSDYILRRLLASKNVAEIDAHVGTILYSIKDFPPEVGILFNLLPSPKNVDQKFLELAKLSQTLWYYRTFECLSIINERVPHYIENKIAVSHRLMQLMSERDTVRDHYNKQLQNLASSSTEQTSLIPYMDMRIETDHFAPDRSESPGGQASLMKFNDAKKEQSLLSLNSLGNDCGFGLSLMEH